MKKEELLERSETFLRGFFEKGLPVEDLLAGADPVDFSWIGPGEKEFFDRAEGDQAVLNAAAEMIRKYWKRQQIMTRKYWKRPLQMTRQYRNSWAARSIRQIRRSIL